VAQGALLVSGRPRIAIALSATLVALAFAAVPAQAAAPPPCDGVAQIADASGDGHHPPTDILSAWLSEANGHLQAAIKVRSGALGPQHSAPGETDFAVAGYAIVFTVDGQARYVRASVAPDGGATYDHGTYNPGGAYFTSTGPTGGELAPGAFSGGTVTIDVPAATGAVTGAQLTDVFALTYDGISGGVPDWVDHGPGGESPGDAARGADYVVGSCAGGVPTGAGVLAVQLEAPARLKGGGKAKVTGKIVPPRAGIEVELTREAGRRSAVSRLTTAADGSFAATVPVSEATRLRAVAEGVASSTLTVEVKSVVRIRVRERPSGAIRLLGRLRPALPGRLLLLEADAVSPTARRATGKGKRFSIRFGAGRLPPGRYQAVYIPARGRAERSTSNTVLIR
jgi:hypothetical protein